SEFMLRCTQELMDGEATGDDDINEDDARDACQIVWDDYNEERAVRAERRKRVRSLQDEAPEPDRNEDHDDYIDRCTTQLAVGHDGADEDDLRDACELAWEELNPYADFQDDERSARRLTLRAARDGLRIKSHAEAV